MSRRAAQPEMAPENEIEISIDELVVHGFSGIDRGRLDLALRGELGRLLQSSDLPAALRNLNPAPQPNLRMGPLKNTTSPEQLGIQIARSLVRSWQPAPAPKSAIARSPGVAPGPEKGKRP